MPDISNKIELYINHQNSKLWAELKYNYLFNLIIDGSAKTWKVGITQKQVEIITPNEEINISSFTHELLHVYMDFLGLPDGTELMKGIKGDKSFKILTENNLLSSIYNFCSHTKMYPFYHSMGFSPEEFVSDRIKVNLTELLVIRLGRNFKLTKNFAINQFIGHSISMMNNVNPNDKKRTIKYLTKFKKIEPALFEIVSNFDQDWRNSDNLNITHYFLEFESNLNNWLENHN